MLKFIGVAYIYALVLITFHQFLLSKISLFAGKVLFLDEFFDVIQGVNFLTLGILK